jgi:hypothetical protein
MKAANMAELTGEWGRRCESYSDDSNKKAWHSLVIISLFVAL